ncbi:hypothetical protein A4H97_11305 [Niastella yeongjuensis]|uniref:Uncharacterized protein n=1 Tax=Niastella yeongjuensis TaxID=354355 RepID=A0A1V9E9Z4_9BACT|nr:hypothetical protein [Niastella yeongjuensis]OQP42745.1 hypothetical protein A4H97_11305 [Niastella yeongjuensis]SEO52224.1 hypothetical protein SAMN05660816_02928 [Niastella yeongjuensis]
MKKIGVTIGVIIVISTTFLSCEVIGQQKLWDGPAAYLGQKPPGDTPEIFAQGMLVDSGIVLGKMNFSTDGRSFYYSYAKHWFSSEGAGTRELSFDGQSWQKPHIIAENLTNPALSPDEKTLYLGAPKGQVWVLHKSPQGWSKPELWMEKPYGLYNFQAVHSNTYYVGSNGTAGSKSDWSTYDFCKLTISGKDTVINSLGSTINTSGFDGDFFIAWDESYIIISAKETKTFECELWISFRKKDNTWSEPQSLGPAINDGLAHRFGQYVSPDGKYLFYTRGTSENDCHFYWVRFDTLLKKLKATMK